MDSKTLRSGQCPACDLTEIYCDDNYSALRNTLVIKKGLLNNIAPFQTYICALCGYMEHYISKPHDLDYIKSNWRRVGEEEKRKRGD